MKSRFIICIIIIVSISGGRVLAQDDRYDEFLIGSRLYKPYTGYLMTGYGYCYNRYLNQIETDLDISYTFRIKRISIRLGYHYCSDRLITKLTYQKLNDVCLLAGWRRETKKSNLSVMGGVTYAYGGSLAFVTNVDGVFQNWYLGFTKPGIYGSVELTRKLSYDLGIGLSIFGSINRQYGVAGLRFHVYISGAFRGTIE